MPAYYSEFDKNAAAWLRELIKRGLIADGEVDERDLWDVAPAELRDFTQVHLCAGIGVWSYSLRRAGWPDDWPVWTASFPCQPFSAAGKGAGFADERHLWPAGQHLISECRPRTIFGEQVASKDAEPWLDAVQADVEALGYAFGACAFPSAGIGAPHIRDRLYWVADAGSGRFRWGREHRGDFGSTLEIRGEAREQWLRPDGGSDGAVVGLADTDGGDAGKERQQRGGEQRQQQEDGRTGRMADTESFYGGTGLRDSGSTGREQSFTGDSGAVRSNRWAGPVNGLWEDADWLFCRDGRWRPVEPGTFPLAHGASARVGRLRGYGNAINAEAAVAWIESYLEARADLAAA